MRFAVLARDGHRCQFCGAKAPEHELTVDPVRPVAVRDRDDLASLVAACKPCRDGRRSLVIEDRGEEADLAGEDYRAAMDQLIGDARGAFETDVVQGMSMEWAEVTGRNPTLRERLGLGRLLLRFDYRGIRDGLKAYARRQGFEEGQECWHAGDNEPHEDGCSTFVAVDLAELGRLLGIWRRDGFL